MNEREPDPRSARFTQLADLMTRMRTRVSTPSARLWLRILGLGVLIGGVIWSVAFLDLTLDKVSPKLLLLNFLILSPINLVLAAVTLGITAKALGRSIQLTDAVQTAAMANAAEILPLPGGAMVRGAALVKAGASLGESAGIITLTSILTLTMTTVVSATALALLGYPASWWLALTGTIGMIGLLAWMAKRISWKLLMAMIVVRLATLALGVVRLAVCFAALGTSVGLTEAALYNVATSLGSTIAIVPAGFGVNEAIAAGLAVLISSSPAAAFLAVALNRATGLAAGAVISIAFMLTGRRQA